MFIGVTPTILRPSLLSAILKPQDVFATSLYTANGSPQNILGPDLAGRGGLVWDKSRNNAVNHIFTDTVRGVSKALFSNTTGAELEGVGVSAFLANGYTSTGTNTDQRVGWSFARASKFFDIVTWTGDGTSNRLIPHGLGVVPGMVIVKRRDAASPTGWPVSHRSRPVSTNLWLNLTDAEGQGARAFSVCAESGRWGSRCTVGLIQ